MVLPGRTRPYQVLPGPIILPLWPGPPVVHRRPTRREPGAFALRTRRDQRYGGFCMASNMEWVFFEVPTLVFKHIFKLSSRCHSHFNHLQPEKLGSTVVIASARNPVFVTFFAWLSAGSHQPHEPRKEVAGWALAMNKAQKHCWCFSGWAIPNTTNWKLNLTHLYTIS